MEYSAGFVLAILQNDDYITSFLESTTGILMPSALSVVPKDLVSFMQQEGHTLWNMGSRTTNVPSRGGMRENLIIWRADISKACKTLTPDEQEAMNYRVSRKAGRPNPTLMELSDQALNKICEYLNG